MNKKNKKILIIGTSLSILVIFVLLEFSPPIDNRKGEEILIPQESPKTFSDEKIKAYLTVENKKYEIETKNNSSVFEIMQKIKEENSEFSFKYKEHTGLGVFVTEINGKKGGKDGYWIYYVNGVEASVGVSNYKIKNGDIISWKYEK